MPSGAKRRAGVRLPTPKAARRRAGPGAGFPRRARRAHPKGDAGAVWFLLPSLAGLAVFVLGPFAGTVWRSFTDAAGRRWQGAANYQSVLANAAFRQAAGNTARFVCVCLPLLLGGSLLLALLVRAARPHGRPFQTSFLLPMALPVASIALLWQLLFAQKGLANALLSALGARPVDFMGSGAAFWVLLGTYLWKNSGYNMVLWLAGLDGVPSALYEAAMLDGAGRWQCFWHVTLPQLGPTLGLVSVLSLLNCFKVFREAYLVAGAYPHESIYLLQHLFNNWFSALDLGRLSAAAVLLALALGGLILILLRLLNRSGE